jgi:hypothetical protein
VLVGEDIDQRTCLTVARVITNAALFEHMAISESRPIIFFTRATDLPLVVDCRDRIDRSLTWKLSLARHLLTGSYGRRVIRHI